MPTKRRPPKSIAKAILLRLDAEEWARLQDHMRTYGLSATDLLRRSIAAYPKTPSLPRSPTTMPALLDASILASLRQIGGLLGHIGRTKTLTPADSRALQDLALRMRSVEMRIHDRLDVQDDIEQELV